MSQCAENVKFAVGICAEAIGLMTDVRSTVRARRRAERRPVIGA
jgi:hypothetical protein